MKNTNNTGGPGPGKTKKDPKTFISGIFLYPWVDGPNGDGFGPTGVISLRADPKKGIKADSVPFNHFDEIPGKLRKLAKKYKIKLYF